MSQQHFQRWLAQSCHCVISDTGIMGKAAEMTDPSKSAYNRTHSKAALKAAHKDFLTLEETRD